MDKTSILLEQYAKSRLEKDKKLLQDDIYFCWRWSSRHFPSQMKTGITPPTDGSSCIILYEDTANRRLLEAILETIIHNSTFSMLLFEKNLVEQSRYLQFTGQSRERICNLHSFLLEVYGDDPEHLGAMWSWAKSSGSLSRVILTTRDPIAITVLPSRSPDSESHAARIKSFREQLQRDYRHLSDSGSCVSFKPDAADQLLSNTSIGWIVSSRNLSQGLGQFLSRIYASSVERLVAERTTALNLSYFRGKHGLKFLKSEGETDGSDPRNPNIVFSVVGSGKTQYLFNLLSSRWGIYLVSGRVPQSEDSSLSIFNARKGASSCDTRHLCGVFDSLVSSMKVYS
jgi:hypothetical protein